MNDVKASPETSKIPFYSLKQKLAGSTLPQTYAIRIIGVTRIDILYVIYLPTFMFYGYISFIKQSPIPWGVVAGLKTK